MRQTKQQRIEELQKQVKQMYTAYQYNEDMKKKNEQIESLKLDVQHFNDEANKYSGMYAGFVTAIRIYLGGKDAILKDIENRLRDQNLSYDPIQERNKYNNKPRQL